MTVSSLEGLSCLGLSVEFLWTWLIISFFPTIENFSSYSLLIFLNPFSLSSHGTPKMQMLVDLMLSQSLLGCLHFLFPIFCPSGHFVHSSAPSCFCYWFLPFLISSLFLFVLWFFWVFGSLFLFCVLHSFPKILELIFTIILWFLFWTVPISTSFSCFSGGFHVYLRPGFTLFFILILTFCDCSFWFLATVGLLVLLVIWVDEAKGMWGILWCRKGGTKRWEKLEFLVAGRGRGMLSQTLINNLLIGEFAPSC